MRVEAWQRNLAALWLGQTLGMVAFSFVFPFFPLYVQTLGVQGTAEAAQWAGVIVAASAISMAVAQPIWGNLADRWGRKPMVVRSMLGAGLTVGAMGFVTSPEQLLLARLIQGAVSGTVAAANALVATSTPKLHIGFALGVMQVAMFLGSSVGPLLGGVIADNLGYRTSFYAAGFLLLLGAVVVVVFVHERFTPPPADLPRAGVWAEARSLLGITLFPLIIGIIFMIQVGGVIVAPVLSLFIAELSGGENEATAAGVVLGLGGAVSAVSAIVLGRLSDRVGRTLILPICVAGAGLSYFPQAFVEEVWQLLILRMLLGVFLGGMMPTANALLVEVSPRSKRGAAFGLAAAAMAIANAVGPLSGAAIASHWGLRAVFLATSGLFLLTLAWVLAGFRRQAEAQRAEIVASANKPAGKDG